MFFDNSLDDITRGAEGGVMEWVKCTEKLPKNQGKVLCFGGEFEDTKIWVGYFKNKVWKCFNPDCGHCYDNSSEESPTHWMPLPKAPK